MKSLLELNGFTQMRDLPDNNGRPRQSWNIPYMEQLSIHEDVLNPKPVRKIVCDFQYMQKIAHTKIAYYKCFLEKDE